MSYNRLKFFDFEVYPEWWCAVVSDEEPQEFYPGKLYENKFTAHEETIIKSKMRIYTSDESDAAQRLKADMSKGVVCGYNIKRYDMVIAKCVFLGYTPQQIYIVSQLLTNHISPESSIEAMRLSNVASRGWDGAESFQDLMDDNVKGLKDKECALGMDIRETTVPFGKTNLTQQEKDDILFYCKHDVYALHVFYHSSARGYIDTKIGLCKIFGIDINYGYKNTNANLCGKVLNAQRIHGSSVPNPEIVIRDEKLKAYFEKWLPPEIYQHLRTSAQSRNFKLCDNIVSIGDGGLHSVYDTPKVGRTTPGLYVEATDEYTMYNVDVSSCYPSVMIYCHAMSRAVKTPERFTQIFKHRVHLKTLDKKLLSDEDKLFIESAKLVLNTTYGAMGNKYLALYDDFMRIKVCRIAQMILIAISNNLYQSIPGLKIVQTNTDGVLVYTKRSDLPAIQKIVDEFTAISSFAFEIEEDSKIWQLNVNNYIAIHPNGEIKNKGGSFITTVFQKGYSRLRPLGNFCIQKAQMDFLIKGNNPVKSLLDNTEVSDFVITCTKGPTYKTMFQEFSDGTRSEVGKVGRCIAITDTKFGTIKKAKHVGTTVKEDMVALCPPHPLVVNDDLKNYSIVNRKLLNNITGEQWDIDYSYYARELDKALDTSWYEIKDTTCGFTKQFSL